MYKVFIESRLIILTKISEKRITKVKYSDTKEIRNSLGNIIFNSKEDVTIESDDLKSLWKEFKTHFKIIIAAGGIVQKGDQFLFIKRHGKWDIPKGKLEKGEDEEQGAIREIEEECNLINPIIDQKICNTYHHYELKGKEILKKSVWFHLHYDGNDHLIPQTEEGITEVRWFKKEEFDQIRANTFSSIIEVLDQFEQL
jgi:8-oxo-dGTP pyrophosphatase MutT (NUDIX family)